MKRCRGFTLLELMVTCVIIAILMAIAIPSYSSHALSSKRTEAKSALMNVLQMQEKYRANCEQYAGQLGSADSCVAGNYTLALSSQSDSGLYALSLSNASGTQFTATATAQGSQQADTACLSLVLSQINGTVTQSPSSCW